MRVLFGPPKSCMELVCFASPSVILFFFPVGSALFFIFCVVLEDDPVPLRMCMLGLVIACCFHLRSLFWARLCLCVSDLFGCLGRDIGYVFYFFFLPICMGRILIFVGVFLVSPGFLILAITYTQRASFLRDLHVVFWSYLSGLLSGDFLFPTMLRFVVLHLSTYFPFSFVCCFLSCVSMCIFLGLCMSNRRYRV